MSKRSKKRRAELQLAQAPPGRLPRAEKLPEEPISISFRDYPVGATYCLSMCSQDQTRLYKDCVRKLTTLTWNELFKQSGKGEHKAGLAYTPYDDNALKGAARPHGMAGTISAVRASQRMRLFGIRRGNVYYVLWYDKDHLIVPD